MKKKMYLIKKLENLSLLDENKEFSKSTLENRGRCLPISGIYLPTNYSLIPHKNAEIIARRVFYFFKNCE